MLSARTPAVVSCPGFAAKREKILDLRLALRINGEHNEKKTDIQHAFSDRRFLISLLPLWAALFWLCLLLDRYRMASIRRSERS